MELFVLATEDFNELLEFFLYVNLYNNFQFDIIIM